MENFQLFKQRDFSALLSDSINLYVKNFRVLGMAILVYAGPFLLLQGLASGLFSYNVLPILGENPDNPFAIFSAMSSLGGYVAMLMAGSILGAAAMVGVVANFLKMTNELGLGGFTYQEVGAASMADLMKNVGAGLLVAVAVIAGMIFFILPGIYLSIPLTMVYFIMKFEGKTATESVGASLKLIKNHWWSTFGLLLILSILTGIITSVLQFPLAGMNAAFVLGTKPNIVSFMGLTGLITIATGLAQGAVYTGIGIKYCSIAENPNGQTTDSWIDEIGEDE